MSKQIIIAMNKIKPLSFVRLMPLLLIGSVLMPGIFPLATASQNGAEVSLPNGFMTVEVDDLKVMTTGGMVRWYRQWDGQEWKFNPYWESLSQSWSNYTCSRTVQVSIGGVSSTISSSSSSSTASADLGSWVWVDEDWQPGTATSSGGGGQGGTDVGSGIPVLIGLPTSPSLDMLGATLAITTAFPPLRTTPFNRSIGNDLTDYPLPLPVDMTASGQCPQGYDNLSSGVTEGIRRQNELYRGSKGRYFFDNKSVIEQQSIRGLPYLAANDLDVQLSAGQITLAPIAIPKGYRWSHKNGDWIDYNLQGQVMAYGNANNNITWLARDTGGRLRGVVDANGHVIFTLHYTGDLLTEVRDYPISNNGQDLPQRKVVYQYDEKNLLTVVIDVLGGHTNYAYNVSSQIIKVTDPEGRDDQYGYLEGTVARRIAPDGGVTDYSYNYDTTRKQFQSTVTGPVTVAGRQVKQFIHESSGDLSQVIQNGRIDDDVLFDTGARTETHTNARGFNTRYTRNEFEQVVRIDYPDQSSYQFNYSAQNLRTLETINEGGIKTQYEYDSKGNLIKKTEASGTADQRITEYGINNLGQNIQVTLKGRKEFNGTTTSDATWLLEYDSQGQIGKTTDPEGGVRKYVFDRTGNLASTTDPLGHTTSYESDASGKLMKVTDAMGRIKSFSYDKVGNLSGFTDARGKQTLASYDAMNRLLSVTNAVGGIAKRQYNSQGLPISVSDEDGRTLQIEFDNFQRLTKLSDAMGNQTQFGYNIPDGTAPGTLGTLSSPTEIKFPTFSSSNRFDQRERSTSGTLLNPNRAGTDNITSAKTYDQRGLVKSDTDANGKKHFYNYDAFGHLTELTDTLGNKTTAFYDARGNLIQLTDANGNNHKFDYDLNDRVLKETLPLGQSTVYSYDAQGNLTQRIDPNGNKSTFAYDASNWLVEIKQYQTGDQLLRSSTFSWDDAYNLIAWSDTDTARPPGQQTTSGIATYDDANRKTSETLTYPNPGGLAYSLSYSYQYSPAGKKTRLTWADGTAIDYTYSGHGQLDSITIPGEGIFSVNQFKWNAPASVTLPGGSVQEKAYDGLLNLEGIKVKAPNQQTLLDLVNTYGKRQELTSRSRTDSLSGASTVTGSFSYDNELRLTQAIVDTGGLFGSKTETFTLDAVGNRTAHSQVLGPWNYDANNRLMDKGILMDATSYEYDAAGNLTRKIKGNQITQFAYDSQNRLNEVRDGSGNLLARYGYDPFDRRVWKEQYRNRSGSALAPAIRTYFLYADEGLIAEATQNITLAADQTVSANALPVLTTQYGPRPDGLFGTGIVFVKTKNTNGDDSFAYYHHDQLGTPIQATDKSGNVVWSADYNVFGRATVTTPVASVDKPTITSRLRLPGQIVDEETGLHYNWHRYYEPEVGRYMTGDPIGLGGDFNLYVYVNGAPIVEIDPMGLAECWMDITHGTLYCIPNSPIRRPVQIPVASGNNGNGSNCKNNPLCTNMSNRGPIPTGDWRWTNGYTSKRNGRVLEPVSTEPIPVKRTQIRSHSCPNAFGHSTQSPFCSEGCITGSPSDMQTLNNLLDSEPNSVLHVMPGNTSVAPTINIQFGIP